MKSICNILYDRPNDNTGLYNVCNKDTMRPGIPTLIVGWENVKKLYPNQSIITWEINKDTYWTFGRREKRDRYEVDIERFKEISLSRIVKMVKYVFFDMLSETNKSKSILLSKITDDASKSAIIIGSMLYLFYEPEMIVYGISLRDIEYEGKSKQTIISLLKTNSSTKFNESGVPFSIINDFIGSKYVLAYLYS